MHRLLSLSIVLPLLALGARAQSVLVVDAAGGPGADFTTLQPALDASLCAGTLWVESCTLKGSAGMAPVVGPRRGATLADCDAVVLIDCDVRAGATGSPNYHSGTDGLYATRSTLWAFQCTFTGSSGTFDDDLGGNAGHGAELRSGTDFFATSCTFHGGDGGAADDDFDPFCECTICGIPGEGGSGVWAQSSALRLQECTLDAGQGGVSLSLDGCADGIDGEPITQLSGSTLQDLAGQHRELRATRVVREGGTLQLVFLGHSGELAWLLTGLDVRPAFLPSKQAPLLVAPPFLIFKPLATLPVAGLATLDLQVPELPVGIDAAVLVSQAYFTGPGTGQLSSGALSVVLDAAF